MSDYDHNLPEFYKNLSDKEKKKLKKRDEFHEKGLFTKAQQGLVTPSANDRYYKWTARQLEPLFRERPAVAPVAVHDVEAPRSREPLHSTRIVREGWRDPQQPNEPLPDSSSSTRTQSASSTRSDESHETVDGGRRRTKRRRRKTRKSKRRKSIRRKSRRHKSRRRR